MPTTTDRACVLARTEGPATRDHGDRKRNRDFDDAVLRRGLDLAGIDPSWQSHRAREGSVAALTPNVLLVLLLLALLVLAGHREDVGLDLDRDVLGLDPGNVDTHNEVAVVTHNVDRRRPRPLTTFGPVVEHAIESSP